MIWVVFIAMLATLALAQEQPIRPSDPKFSKESMANSEAQRERIKQELAGSNLPDWAGSYFYGDGEGVNVDLRLAPRSGVVAAWHGCLGLYDLNYGKVAWSEGKVGLRFTYPNNPQHRGSEGFPEELIPVRWRERHYLIPADQMIEFANAINRGSEPRKAPHGSFLLKRGDEKKAAGGAPALPAAYAAYILKKPIRTTVVSVGESRTVGDQTISARHTEVMLKAGEAEGVKVGMEFYVYGSGGSFASAKITKTQEHSSEADLDQDEFPNLPKDPMPAVGWKLTTALGK